MSKKRFLKLLEEKLFILNEEERQDILNEYSDIIDEKVKHGKTEKEAVEDFNNIDELAEEILKAYKINPNYEKQAMNDTKRVMDNFEDWISKMASSLEQGTKKVYNDFKNANGEMSGQMIFEILIKFILLLFGLVILRIPFEIISHLGKGIFDVFLFPIDSILSFIWQFMIAVIYFIVCALIFITVFKSYFGKSDSIKYETKSQKKSEVKIEKELKEEKHKKEEKEYSKPSSIKLVYQIIMTIIFLLPIWCINFSLVMGIIIMIYLLWKGIAVLGLLIVMIGLSFLFGFLADLIRSFIYMDKRVHFAPFIVSAVLIMIGGIIFAENSLDFVYKNKPDNNLLKTITYNEIISGNTNIEIDAWYDSKKLVVNDELDDNEIIIEIKYYDVFKIDKNVNHNKIEINTHDFKTRRQVFELIIEDLKRKEIYNYSELFKIDVIIYANNETINKLD